MCSHVEVATPADRTHPRKSPLFIGRLSAELKLQNQRRIEWRDNGVHQRAHLVHRIVCVSTTNAPSVPPAPYLPSQGCAPS